MAGKNTILSRPTLRYPIHRLPFLEAALWKTGATGGVASSGYKMRRYFKVNLHLLIVSPADVVLS